MAPTNSNPGSPSSSFDSYSQDVVSAVGLQDIDVNVDAEATVAATSTAKSTATSENVDGTSGSLSNVDFNSGLQASISKTNVFDVESNAGLSGIATTTANASAATSAGDAKGYATIGDSAGISDVSKLEVGGELNALGKSVNTITGSAQTVVGSAEATGFLEGSIQGFEATGIDVSSNAGIQGLAQLTNSATAAATSGAASTSSAEAIVQDLTGAFLDGLEVGGVGSIAGQASLGNTSKATNVDGAAEATSQLVDAIGLEATIDTAGSDTAGIDVSSDATITGLSSITSSATAATTDGLADALSSAGTITGMEIADANIGGVGSITGQSTFTSSAKSNNVTGGLTGEDSNADSTLQFADGLIAGNKVDVSSDATLKGLSSINMSAMAESTGSVGAETVAHAGFSGDTVTGASLEEVQIGGIGNVLGQAGFTGVADASNVTGTAEAFGALVSDTGLATSAKMDISSDATVKGIASVTGSATAATTAGLANAELSAQTLTGASLDEVQIGGIGNLLGQVGFTGTATGNSVIGDAYVTSQLESATGLVNDDVMHVSSDATIKGINSVTGSATAATTNGESEANALAESLIGAQLDTVDVGGIGSIQGATNFNLSAKSTNVTGGSSTATAGGNGVDFDLMASGLQAADLGNLDAIHVASDATVSGTAIGSLKAEAASTADAASAFAGNGADLFGAQITTLDVGGIANVTGAAQLSSTASATNVGDSGLNALAESGLDARVTGLDIDFMGVASDATITAQAFGTLNSTATSIGGNATARAGELLGLEATLTGLVGGADFSIGGVGTISALGQGTVNAKASTVDGQAEATGAMRAFGMDGGSTTTTDISADIASDGNITGIAKIAATVDASNIGAQDDPTTGTVAAPVNEQANAVVNGDFSATGITGLDLGSFNADFSVATNGIGIGGVTTLKGQAQVTGTLSAESVSGAALAGLRSADSFIVGLGNFDLAGASDGSIFGSASGAFNTSASSTLGYASAKSVQNLTGMGGPGGFILDLGGNGTINAIVTDTNFVTAHSVSGNATAVASVDAIGLDGGRIHIAGNATIMANVGVDSKAEAHTVG